MYLELRSRAEWHTLRPEIDKRIAALVDDLARPGTNLDDTNVLRGRIAELRRFVEQVEPKHFIPPTEPTQVNDGSGY